MVIAHPKTLTHKQGATNTVDKANRNSCSMYNYYQCYSNGKRHYQGGVTSMPSVVLFAFTIKIHLDQKIINNCRYAQIYNDIHIIIQKL